MSDLTKKRKITYLYCFISFLIYYFYISIAMDNKNTSSSSDNKNHRQSGTSSDKKKNYHKKQMKQKLSSIDSVGKIPLPRFGHSLTLISPTKAILFGGAVGDTKSFQFSNETFIYNIMTKIWMNLSDLPYTTLPEPRSAHAAAANDSNQLLIHSGSVGSKLVNITYIFYRCKTR